MYAVAALGFDTRGKSLPCLPSSFPSPSSTLHFPSHFIPFLSFLLPFSLTTSPVCFPSHAHYSPLPPYPTLRIQLRSLGSTVSFEAGLGGSRLPNAFLCFGSLISGLSSDRFGRFLQTKMQSVCCVYAQSSALLSLQFIPFQLILTAHRKKKI